MRRELRLGVALLLHSPSPLLCLAQPSAALFPAVRFASSGRCPMRPPARPAADPQPTQQASLASAASTPRRARSPAVTTTASPT